MTSGSAKFWLITRPGLTAFTGTATVPASRPPTSAAARRPARLRVAIMMEGPPCGSVRADYIHQAQLIKGRTPPGPRPGGGRVVPLPARRGGLRRPLAGHRGGAAYAE